MKTKPVSLAVVEFNKDGSVFPVRLDVNTQAEADHACAWMKVGQGEHEDWRVIPMTELRKLLHANRVTLAPFTAEAQAEKRALIEAAQ